MYIWRCWRTYQILLGKQLATTSIAVLQPLTTWRHLQTVRFCLLYPFVYPRYVDESSNSICLDELELLVWRHRNDVFVRWIISKLPKYPYFSLFWLRELITTIDPDSSRHNLLLFHSCASCISRKCIGFRFPLVCPARYLLPPTKWILII